MNKFLKGAVACAALVPCVTGLTACGEKKKAYTAENAYDAVFAEVGNMMTKLSNIQNPNSEFQLNINLSLNCDVTAPGMNTEIDAKLRAVIGARNSDNKELFGNIGFVKGEGAEEQFISLLTAYAKDEIDKVDGDADEDYTPVTVTEDTWANYVGLVYVKPATGDPVLATEYDSTAEYYLKTDVLHFYLSSHLSNLKEYTKLTSAPADWSENYTSYYQKIDKYIQKAPDAVYEAGLYYKPVQEGAPVLMEDETAPLDWETGIYYIKGVAYVAVDGENAPVFADGEYYEQTGIDIQEFLEEYVGMQMPEGKIYATYDLIEAPVEPATPGEPEMSLDAILAQINEMDFETFKQSMGEGITFTGEKYKNGNVGLKMSAEGTTMEMIVKAGGGLTITVNVDKTDEGVRTAVGMTLDIDLDDEVDESYIPTLEGYDTESVDLEELIAGLMGSLQ